MSTKIMHFLKNNYVFQETPNIVYNIIGLIKQFLKMKVFFILTAIFIYYRIHGTPIVVCHVCVINIENVYILL